MRVCWAGLEAGTRCLETGGQVFPSSNAPGLLNAEAALRLRGCTQPQIKNTAKPTTAVSVLSTDGLALSLSPKRHSVTSGPCISTASGVLSNPETTSSAGEQRSRRHANAKHPKTLGSPGGEGS